MKKIISFILIGILFSFGIFCVSNAVNITIPKASSDINSDYPSVQWEGNVTISYLSLIKFANDYLWFWVGFICFVFIIWNGYQLIMARGDTEQMKKATKALIWFWVGIAVFLLAYSIINIATKLF